MSQNFLSAAVVIGALRVDMKIIILFFPLLPLIIMAGNVNFQNWVKKCFGCIFE